MSNLSKTIIIEAAPERVWAILKDFGGVHRWHPKVESSPLTGARNEGLGAGRVCNFYDGTSVREQIVEYRDGESMRVELSEFSMPLHRAEARLALRVLGQSRTEVTFSMDYDVKFGPLGWVMNSLMMQPMLAKMFEQILESLRHHVITGELVGRDGERQGVSAAAA